MSKTKHISAMTLSACQWGVFLGVGLTFSAGSLSAQEVIYQEGFNSDGEPARYTTTGKAVYEPDKIRSELNNADQKGPIYWARNTDVSFVGIPNIPGRRMIFTWKPTDLTTATEDLLKLYESSVNWLLNNKKNATIAVSPNSGALGGLTERLAAAGHTIVEDDASILNDADIKADLYLHGTGGNASRYALLPQPVIVTSGADLDDMIVGSIGSTVSFEPGQVNIAAAGHPAAGGKTGSFKAFTGSQTFEIVGRFLPDNATTLATVDRTVPPAVTRLTDVDELVAGTKQNSKATGKVTELDFADGTAGSWPNDNQIPGGYAGNWGLQVKGKISVARAGTYRFAAGSDDGVLLQIDRDKNGLTAADNIIQDFGPHGHTIVYQDVNFAAAGSYDFEVRAYNSGGGGSLEISVATAAGDVADNALDSGFWEVLSTVGTSPVKLEAQADVTGFIATGANTTVREPLIVLLNGPTENPPGFFYGGGPFSGFEGTGYFAGAGMNKWPFPDGQNYRSVTLKPVNVAGKKNVKLTVALAGARIDFEDNDFLDILIYPNGANSAPVTLAHFRGVQNGVQPWLADQKEGFVRRLEREFADFTYDVPATATDLIVEFRVFSSWWNEILALDNVRITSGAPGPPVGGAAVVTLEVRVAGGLDDSEEHLTEANAIDITSSDLELGSEGGGADTQAIGIRFRNIDIPAGSTINKAYIQFTVDEADTEVTSVRIYGELSPNPVEYSTTASDITVRKRTTASVDWNNIPVWNDASIGSAGPDQRTPDLTPIVRELIGQAGWSAKNAMAFIIMPNPGGERTAEAFEGDAAAAPLLHIEYTPSAAPAPAVGNLTGLIGYWRMDETSGDVVADASGKGNNGKIVNNTAGSWVKDAVRGNVYKATGTNVINFGTILPAMTLNSDFTWSLWVKSDMTGTASAANNNIVFGNRYNVSGADFSPREFIKFTPSNFEWHFSGAGQNINYTDFVTNTWAHHLVVKKGNTLTYYLDGKQANTGAITGAPRNPQPLYLGGQGTQERWRGSADEVAIFDRALTVAEAQQVYDLGKAGSALAPPPLKLGFERTATALKLTFDGTLQSADAVSGPWADVAGAKSPAEIPFSGGAKFYRIKK